MSAIDTLAFDDFDPVASATGPALDGFILHDIGLEDPSLVEMGYTRGCRYIWAGGGQSLAIFQGVKQGNTLVFGFFARFDQRFDENDKIIIALKPSSAAPVTQQRRIDINPVHFDLGAGGGPVGLEPDIRTDQDPLAVTVRKGFSDPDEPDARWQACAEPITAKVRSWRPPSPATDVGWSVEVRVPMTPGTDWITIGDNFRLFFSIIRNLDVNGEIFYAGLQFPRDRAKLTGADGTTLDIPASSYGIGRIGTGLGQGVRFKADFQGIGRLSDPSATPTTSSAITRTMTRTFNRLVARVENTSPSETAADIQAEFRFGRYGLPAGSTTQQWHDWSQPAGMEPIGIVPKRTVPVTLAPSSFGGMTTDWTLTPAEKTDFAANRHRCMVATLHSTSNVNFTQASVRANTDFDIASEVAREAEVSGKGYPPPADGSDELEMLLFTFARAMQGSALLEIYDIEGGTDPTSTLTRDLLAAVVPPKEQVGEPDKTEYLTITPGEWRWFHEQTGKQRFEMEFGGRGDKFRLRIRPPGPFDPFFWESYDGTFSSGEHFEFTVDPKEESPSRQDGRYPLRAVPRRGRRGMGPGGQRRHPAREIRQGRARARHALDRGAPRLGGDHLDDLRLPQDRKDLRGRGRQGRGPGRDAGGVLRRRPAPGRAGFRRVVALRPRLHLGRPRHGPTEGAVQGRGASRHAARGGGGWQARRSRPAACAARSAGTGMGAGGDRAEERDLRAAPRMGRLAGPFRPRCAGWRRRGLPLEGAAGEALARRPGEGGGLAAADLRHGRPHRRAALPCGSGLRGPRLAGDGPSATGETRLEAPETETETGRLFVACPHLFVVHQDPRGHSATSAGFLAVMEVGRAGLTVARARIRGALPEGRAWLAAALGHVDAEKLGLPPRAVLYVPRLAPTGLARRDDSAGFGAAIERALAAESRAAQRWSHWSDGGALLFDSEVAFLVWLLGGWSRAEPGPIAALTALARPMPPLRYVAGAILIRGTLLPALIEGLAKTGTLAAVLRRFGPDEVCTAMAAIAAAHALRLDAPASGEEASGTRPAGDEAPSPLHRIRGSGSPSRRDRAVAARLREVAPEAFAAPLVPGQQVLAILGLALTRAPNWVRSEEARRWLASAPEMRERAMTAPQTAPQLPAARALAREGSARPLRDSELPEEDLAPPQTAVTRPSPQPSFLAAEEVETEFGGLFFLLNVFLSLGLYADFTRPGGGGLATSPWLLLRRVGRHWFGERFAADHLDVELAVLAGMPPGARMPRAPRGEAFRPLERQLRAALAKGLGVRRRDAPCLLCQCAAVVRKSPGAVDVMFTLGGQPIAIRAAGLDRDPGWIPAAGRALAFHFG